jgi:hypothetical protein
MIDSEDFIQINYNGTELDFGPFVVQFTIWFEARFAKHEMQYLGVITGNIAL